MKDWVENVFFQCIFTMISGPYISDTEVSKHQIIL